MFTVKARFAFTLFSNIARGLLSFATGALLARGLGPAEYGNFVFLLGSFTALRSLLELGTSTAFFTFLSQKPRPAGFILSYVLWQILQLCLLLLAIVALMPNDWVMSLWLGQDRSKVALAFLASFLMQQAWQTVAQIAESRRFSIKVQSISLVVASMHLLLVLLAWTTGHLSLWLVFTLIVIEYALAILAAMRLIGLGTTGENGSFNLKDTVKDYVIYCKPLALYSFLSFAYAFADNWFLQKYGGATEQGYYAAAYQVIVATLLVSTSMINIFWKEIAEAHEQGSTARVAMLYDRVVRFVFLSGAIIAGGVLPWCRDLSVILFGRDFENSTEVLAILLFYPAYASIGQIIGIAFVATGNTRAQVQVGIILMAIGIPVSYLVQAPADMAIPGFALGAVGLALKAVVLTMIMSNVMAWRLAKDNGWRFNWKYQGVMFATFILGYAAYFLVDLVSRFVLLGTILQPILGLLLYSVFALLLVWKAPRVAGLADNELRDMIASLKTVRRPG